MCPTERIRTGRRITRSKSFGVYSESVLSITSADGNQITAEQRFHSNDSLFELINNWWTGTFFCDFVFGLGEHKLIVDFVEHQIWIYITNEVRRSTRLMCWFPWFSNEWKSNWKWECHRMCSCINPMNTMELCILCGYKMAFVHFTWLYFWFFFGKINFVVFFWRFVFLVLLPFFDIFEYFSWRNFFYYSNKTCAFPIFHKIIVIVTG